MIEKMSGSTPSSEAPEEKIVETPDEKLERLFPNTKPLGPNSFVDSHGIVQSAGTVEEAAKLHEEEREAA
jgi:hypothetical protein